MIIVIEMLAVAQPTSSNIPQRESSRRLLTSSKPENEMEIEQLVNILCQQHGICWFSIGTNQIYNQWYMRIA